VARDARAYSGAVADEWDVRMSEQQHCVSEQGLDALATAERGPKLAGESLIARRRSAASPIDLGCGLLDGG
jgi:hypothetical protein